MRMRVSAVTAVAACLALGACTGGTVGDSDEGSAEGRTDSLKWLIEEPEDATALDALEEHVTAFEEESGIDVTIDTLDLQNMRSVLATQLRSGEGPDVFSWGSGPSFGGALAEAGLLMDLTPHYEEHGWEVFDFAKERVTTDGKIYGIPGELETIGLFYNQDVLDELGLEPPESLDDLRAVSEAVREAGTIPMAAPDKEGWEGGHYLSMALSSAIGSDGMEELFTGDRQWDSQEVVDSIALWQQFNDEGFLSESPTSVDYDTGIAQFFSGEAAMIPTGSWLVGEIDDNADFEVGYIPFPAPDGEGIFTGGLGSGPYVSKTTDNPEGAVEFLDFLASEEHGQWTVENLHTIPPQPIETEGLDVSPLFAQVLEKTEAVTSTGDFGYNIDVMATEAVNKAMYDGVQAVITGQMSAEEVAAELQAASEK
ncbi:extracellular solute-binding protein [Alloalcanivorax gelatiniphagus]